MAAEHGEGVINDTNGVRHHGRLDVPSATVLLCFFMVLYPYFVVILVLTFANFTVIKVNFNEFLCMICYLYKYAIYVIR